MEKRTAKRIFAFFIISLFLIALVAPFIHAQNKILIEGKAPIETVFAWLTKVTGGGSGSGGSSVPLSQNADFVRVLFGILIAMIVYSIASALPFMKEKELVKWIFSIVFAILATFFLGDSEIWTTLFTYKVFGVSMLMIIPFVVMLVFTVELGTSKPQYAWIGKLLWIVAAIVFVFMFIGALFDPSPSSQLGVFGYFLYGIIVLIAIILAWKFKSVIMLIAKEKIADAEAAIKLAAKKRSVTRKAELEDYGARAREAGVDEETSPD